MVKLMVAKLFPQSAKMPGGHYFTIHGQTGGLGNPFLGKSFTWQLHIERKVSVSTDYILNIAKYMRNNTLAIILWRETNEKDLGKN